MTANELRKKYLDFFVSKGHKIIPPASLVPENDPTTLFTSSGMQQLIPYLKGQPHPQGKCLVNSQPCFRAEDIDEVGDNRHTTFFEMLGNWSLGDPASPDGIGQGGYFKEQQLTWVWEFLTKELGLPKEKLYVTYFKGDGQISEDLETKTIWQKLDIAEDHIFPYGADKNWWSRSGTPDQMPVGEIGGPDSEIFYEFTEVEHNPKFGEKCHPNCDCGRFLEIGNSVFIQYEKQADNTFKELPQKNVDYGGGLERLEMVIKGDPDIFKIDLFKPIIETIEKVSGKNYSDSQNQSAMRVIADHVKASVFLIIGGVKPSNKMQGYVLRRLLRRAAIKAHQLDKQFDAPQFEAVAGSILEVYNQTSFKKDVETEIGAEILKFKNTLDKGLKEFEKLSTISGKDAFNLFQTYGFPLELTEELAEEKGLKINREEFEEEFKKHQELSRTASSGMFKGGLSDSSQIVTRYHTATHLLNAALHQILGNHIEQKGSNITAERLRFDFSHPEKLSPEQIKQVEDLVNQKIKEDLLVTSEIMDRDQALQSGAIGVFGEKYGERVTVYTIGSPSTPSGRSGSLFSREICGGPHVKSTGELGTFKITREESSSAGIRRIYATLS